MRRIFFDTNLFLYMFEGLEPFSTRMLGIRRRMVERGDRIVTSALTLGEILLKPTQLGQASIAEEYDRAIRSTSEIVNFDVHVARRYASLCAAHALRTADAMQLACAAHAGVDLFITSDAQLRKLNVPEIGFIATLDRVPL